VFISRMWLTAAARRARESSPQLSRTEVGKRKRLFGEVKDVDGECGGVREKRNLRGQREFASNGPRLHATQIVGQSRASVTHFNDIAALCHRRGVAA